MNKEERNFDTVGRFANAVKIRAVNRMVRHDTISILIPSDTIFADTSKNYTIRYRSINSYIDIIILYTYFKQPSTFSLAHKCNQNI